MTEGINKKFGFVIDFNENRIIEHTIINFINNNSQLANLHPRKAIEYLLKSRLLHFNADFYLSEFGNDDLCLKNITNNIYNIYIGNTNLTVCNLLEKLQFKNILLSKDVLIEFNKLFNNKKKFISSISESKYNYLKIKNVI
jgi:hypothetical protein